MVSHSAAAMGEHDLFFKHVFGVAHRAAGAIRSVVPAAIVERLDLDALERVPATFVSPELADRHADLVFRTRLDGAEAYVYVLLEHQSEPDPLMPFRMLEYVVRLWSAVLGREPARRTLPPVVPIVVHHGESGWTAARRLGELVECLDRVPALRAFTPELQLLVDDLVRVDDAALAARPVDAYARVAFFALRDARRGEELLAHLTAWAALLTRLTDDDRLAALRYLLRAGRDLDLATLQQHVARAAPGTEEAMGTIAEELERRGMEKGERLGLAKGRREALRETLTMLVSDRFGAPDDETRRRIDRADEAALRRAVGRVMHAATPGALFDD